MKASVRSLVLLSVLVFSAVIMVGCGDKGTGPSGGGNLVLGAGEAWVDDNLGMTGYIFKGDGTMYTVVFMSAAATEGIATGPLEYTTSGNSLTMVGIKYTYKVSGSTLTLTPEGAGGHGLKFTKRIGLTLKDVFGNNIDSNTGGDNGGNNNQNAALVCGTGQAWVDEYSVGSRDGFILRANGTYTAVTDDNGSTWESEGNGTWTTNGDTLTLTGNGYYTGSHIYSLSSSNNTLTFGNTTFTKLSGVEIGGSIGGGVLDSRLVNGANEVWSDYYDAGNRDGFILHADGKYTSVVDRGVWEVNGSGTWTANNGTLTLIGNGYYGGDVGSYSLSGNNTLIFRGDTFNRLSGIVIGGDDGGGDNGGSNAADLICTASEAWLSCMPDPDLGEFCYGFSIRANNDMVVIIGVEGMYFGAVEGTWSVVGNTILVDGVDPAVFNVSGNTLTLTADGDTDVYTKRSGLNVIIVDDDFFDDLFSAPGASAKAKAPLARRWR